MSTKHIEVSYWIARAFVTACLIICCCLAITVIILFFSAPNILGLGLMFAAIRILPIPLFIWGLTLFVRYGRFLKNKLTVSEKQLWIETIVLNLLNLGLCFWSISSVLPLYATVLIGLWNVVAIVLSVIALSKSQLKVL